MDFCEIFKALGDPTRLKIIRLLASNPERSLCVGALAQRLGITQPAVSQHLKVLKNVGIVNPNRDGFRVHYTINFETLAEFKNNWDELSKLAMEPCSCDEECQEQKEEVRLLPGTVRTDEIVFNVPGLGKNYLRALQHHELISILPDGRRVYEFHPWEEKLALADTYVYTDVSIHDYLRKLKAAGEDTSHYRTIWYYY